MEENFTPEQSAIRKEIDTLRQTDSYLNSFHVDHPATQEKVQALYQKLYPEEGGDQLQPSETPSEQPTEPKAEADPLDNPLTPEEAQHISPLQQEWGPVVASEYRRRPRRGGKPQ